jgi:predicted unusual protein kinase regulating ubiquinone biosynthesis (AarF/ABC1/UbiB family)
MHPGNILVREVDRSGGIAERFALLLKQLSAGLPLPGVREVFRNVVMPPTPQLVLLDTGMIAELSKSDRSSVLEFFKVRACRHRKCNQGLSGGQQQAVRVRVCGGGMRSSICRAGGGG